MADVASVDKGSKVSYSHTSDAFLNAPHALGALNNAPDGLDGLDALKKAPHMLDAFNNAPNGGTKDVPAPPTATLSDPNKAPPEDTDKDKKGDVATVMMTDVASVDKDSKVLYVIQSHIRCVSKRTTCGRCIK